MVFRKGLRADVSLERHRRARPGGAKDEKRGESVALFPILRSTAARAVVANIPYNGRRDPEPCENQPCGMPVKSIPKNSDLTNS